MHTVLPSNKIVELPDFRDSLYIEEILFTHVFIYVYNSFIKNLCSTPTRILDSEDSVIVQITMDLVGKIHLKKPTELKLHYI